MVPTHADIWAKMSNIDVSEFVKSRGVGNRTLSWIPWSDCLALLQAHYPEFEYEFSPAIFYPDGSAEVGCTVTIGEVSRRVELPVMDYKFDAVSNPSSRDINDGRWRAFVKAVGILTGLGFQLYRDGSGIPLVPVKKAGNDAEHLADRLDTLTALLDACEEHGGVDAKVQKLGRELVTDGGPTDRVEAAIRHLERELERA
jgi:hypothetical protein